MNKLLLSMPGGSEWLLIILVPVIFILILMAIRKPIMWYNGIMDIIIESRKQTALLEEIRDSLKKENDNEAVS